MPYEFLKQEVYTNVKGINLKASDYVTGDTQVLDLRNFSFERPGAWSTRPGYTGFQTLVGGSYAPNSLFQYVIQTPATFAIGITNMTDPNLPVNYFNLTLYGYTPLSTSIVASTSLYVYDSGTTLYELKPSFMAIGSGLGPGSSGVGAIDFTVFNNILYYANGFDFAKYDGTGSFSYSMANPNLFFTQGANVGSLFYKRGGGTPPNAAPTVTLTDTNQYIFRIGPARYIPGKNKFEFGPYAQSTTRNNSSLDSSIDFTYGSGLTFIPLGLTGLALTFAVNLTSSSQIIYDDPVSKAQGVSYLALYGPNNTDGALATLCLWCIYPLNYTQAPPQSGLTVLGNCFNVTSNAGVTQCIIQYCSSFARDQQGQFVQNFFANTSGTSVAQGSFSLIPKYLETFNNMLFTAGFSSQPSTVWYSEIGAPEDIGPEDFFDVRTEGNGDVITAMKVFQTTLMIFKNNSTHQLSGDSPDTLALADIDLEYGCVSNDGVVTFDSRLWFMDARGIYEFNGNNINVVSEEINVYLSACDKTTAKFFHLKKYNQVWCLVKNTTLNKYKAFVYDYFLSAWTIYDNFDLSGAGLFDNGRGEKELNFYGNNPSLLPKFFAFNSSMFTDDGSSVTHIIKTKYHKRLGDSTTEVWRRFYLNNSVEGSTLGVTINFIPDYGSSIYLTRSVGMTTFQSRLEIGIPAKSLSAQIILQATTSVQINGYTFESRFLRPI